MPQRTAHHVQATPSLLTLRFLMRNGSFLCATKNAIARSVEERTNIMLDMGLSNPYNGFQE